MLPIDTPQLNNFAAGQMLKDVAVNWFNYIEQRYAKKTKQSYKFVLNEFLSTLPPNVRKHDITPLHIQNFIQHLSNTNHTNRTCNHYFIILKSFFRYASDNHQISNPTKHITRLAEKPPKSRCLSEAEYIKVLGATTGFDNAAMRFLANTGVRSSEYRNLEWTNFIVDPDKGFCFIYVLGKGGKGRYIPLNNVCKQVISEYPQNGEVRPTFVQHFQYREKLYLLGQSLARKLNIPPFGPHALRHYFATRLIRAGVPLIKVSKLLGHSSITITEQIYIHLVPLDFSGATDVLNH